MPPAFSLIKGWEGAGRGVHCTETAGMSLRCLPCCGDAVSLTTRLKGGQESNERHDPSFACENLHVAAIETKYSVLPVHEINTFVIVFAIIDICECYSLPLVIRE